MEQVFISHASEDKHAARDIANYLEEKGIDTFIDEKYILGGDNLGEAFTNAIDHVDCVVFLVSSRIADSDWVEREFNIASQKKKKIIPILIEFCKVPVFLNDILHIDLTSKLKHSAGLDRAVDIIKQKDLRIALENLKSKKINLVKKALYQLQHMMHDVSIVINDSCLASELLTGLIDVFVLKNIKAKKKNSLEKKKIRFLSLRLLSNFQVIYRNLVSSSSNLVPLTQLPGIVVIVEHIKSDPDSEIRTKAISAIMKVFCNESDEDREILGTILQIAFEQDISSAVKLEAKKHLDFFSLHTEMNS